LIKRRLRPGLSLKDGKLNARKQPRELLFFPPLKINPDEGDRFSRVQPEHEDPLAP
jgi:hypothetical protein